MQIGDKTWNVTSANCAWKLFNGYIIKSLRATYGPDSTVKWQWRIHGGIKGEIAPPRLGPKNIIARPKNTDICKPPFACQNVLKLTYSNLEFQHFPGRTPDPLFKGREGMGREGRTGALDMGSAPPPETSSGSAPVKW